MSKVCGETVAVSANGDNATHRETKCETVEIADRSMALERDVFV